MQTGSPELGFASSGSMNDCLGKADNIAVSLGDNGIAVVKFAEPVKDIPGNDFAVFENSFDGRFLELAFIEVSSDSLRWVKFPSVSLTSPDAQIGTFGILDPEKTDNLAGKYQARYGTPFDLTDIKDSAGIDLAGIKYIRITDVIGSVSAANASRDSKGNIINDPWPTPFPQSGFDLDAVAVLQSVKNDSELVEETGIMVYPNPAATNVRINFTRAGERRVFLYDSCGRIIIDRSTNDLLLDLDVSSLGKGLYFIRITGNKSETIRKLIIG
jgi:hypothetical protein